ncbi:MAG: MerR family transcriptional regulator [Gammaproteobacteria bacterium]|nr:MerR family transcriptional regulator [Gammaproteobacteria bacterium]
MKVIDLAKKANVTSETVRFYTREGLIQATKNPDNGYNIYDDEALQRLELIIKSRTLGFGLKEIKEILDNVADGHSPCPIVREILQEKIINTQKHIQELQSQLALMQKTYDEWRNAPDAEADEKSLCPIINSVGYCHEPD